MNILRKLNKALQLSAALLLASLATPAWGAVTINFQQVGTDVYVSYSGSIETDELTYNQLYYANYASMSPNTGSLAAFAGIYEKYFVEITGPEGGFGGSGSAFAADNIISIYSFGFSDINDDLDVAQNYVSGSLFSGSYSYTDTDYSDLSLSAGEYVFTLTSGSYTDTITVDVAAVPEPAQYALVASVGCLFVAFLRRRKTV